MYSRLKCRRFFWPANLTLSVFVATPLINVYCRLKCCLFCWPAILTPCVSLVVTVVYRSAVLISPFLLTRPYHTLCVPLRATDLTVCASHITLFPTLNSHCRFKTCSWPVFTMVVNYYLSISVLLVNYYLSIITCQLISVHVHNLRPFPLWQVYEQQQQKSVQAAVVSAPSWRHLYALLSSFPEHLGIHELCLMLQRVPLLLKVR
jgi:hypothetical protein